MSTVSPVDPGRISRWGWVVATAIAVAVALLLGSAVMRSPLPGANVLTAGQLLLDPPLPATVHAPDATTAVRVQIAGRTTPALGVFASVDGRDRSRTFAASDGAFSLSVALVGYGSHEVRVRATARGPYGTPSEQTASEVIVAPDVLEAPSILGAIRDPDDPAAFRVAFRITPGAGVTSPDADLVIEGPGPSRSSERLTYLVHPRQGSSARFALVDERQSPGPLTQPVDLASIGPAPKAIPLVDQTNVDVTIDVSRSSVTQLQRVVLGRDRPELADLVGGQDSVSFLAAVAAAGIRAPNSGVCVLQRSAAVRPELELGERGTVTVREDFGDVLTGFNGFSYRPSLQLCFPDGLPPVGVDGTLTVRVVDFDLVSVAPRPSSVAIDRTDPGRPVRTYVWNRVEPGTDVRLSFGADVPTLLGLLPKARLGDFIRDQDLGPLVSSIFYALVQGTGLLLLLGVTARALPAETWNRRARAAATDVLTLGLALTLIPPLGPLSDAFGYRVATQIDLNFVGSVDRQLEIQPSDVGGWLLVLAIGIGGLVVAVWARHRPILGRIFAAVVIAAVTWVVLGIAGRVVLAAAAGAGFDELGRVRVAVWVASSGLLAVFVLIAMWRFAPPIQIAPPRINSQRVAWMIAAVAVALIVGLPLGTGPARADQAGGAVALYDRVAAGMVSLVAFGYGVAAVAVIAIVVRASWATARWELVVGARRFRRPKDDGISANEQLIRRAGRAIFAGFVVGTAGVFAVLPLPFLIAYLAFPTVFGRPPRDIGELARNAPDIRARGLTTPPAEQPPADTEPAGGNVNSVQANASTEAPEPGPPGATPSIVVASPPPRTALGPHPTIWGNARLGIQVALGLALFLTLIYVGQYNYGLVTTEDHLFVQRFLLNVAAFDASWLIIGFLFGFMYEEIRGETAIQKGLWIGLVMTVFTVPFVLISNVAAGLPAVSVTLRVLQIFGFTLAVGGIFDLVQLHAAGQLSLAHPKRAVADLGSLAGDRQVGNGLLAILGAVGGTIGTIALGQLTQFVTQVLTPFLPIPTQ